MVAPLHHLPRPGPAATCVRRLLCLGLALGSAPLAAVSGCSSAEVEQKKLQDKADFRYKLALGYFQARNIDLAIRELIQSFEYQQNHPDSRYLYGFILFGRKQYEEAAQNLRAALVARPRFFAARNHLGVTYMALERWQEAVEIMMPLLKEPTYTTPYLAHNNIGWAHLKHGDLRKAERHLRMSVFINAKFCQGHRNLGLLAVEQRDLSAAVSHMEEAIKRCPKVAEFQFQLGEVLAASGLASRAEAAFETCRKLAGETVLGRRCGARLSGPAPVSMPSRTRVPQAPFDQGDGNGTNSP